MEIYTVSKNDPIYIYGMGEVGRKIEHSLSNARYKVEGFIDIQADELRLCSEFAIYNTDYVPDKDSVLIISLQNGMAHKEVAKHYYSFGLNKIVMLPMDLKIPLWKKRIYRRSYFKVTNGLVDEITIPLYKSEKEFPEIIDEMEDYVSFWAPIKSLFVFPTVFMYKSASSFNDAVSMANLPDSLIEEYNDLFKFLSGDENIDISNYLFFQQQTTEKQKEIYINYRRSMFATYQNALRYDMAYFTDSPARVTWEDNIKGFIVNDGNHRISFLVFMGYKQVPVYCLREDWIKYLNYEQSSEIAKGGGD